MLYPIELRVLGLRRLVHCACVGQEFSFEGIIRKLLGVRTVTQRKSSYFEKSVTPTWIVSNLAERLEFLKYAKHVFCIVGHAIWCPWR